MRFIILFITSPISCSHLANHLCRAPPHRSHHLAGSPLPRRAAKPPPAQPRKTRNLLSMEISVTGHQSSDHDLSSHTYLKYIKYLANNKMTPTHPKSLLQQHSKQQLTNKLGGKIIICLDNNIRPPISALINIAKAAS